MLYDNFCVAFDIHWNHKLFAAIFLRTVNRLCCWTGWEVFSENGREKNVGFCWVKLVEIGSIEICF